MSAKAEKQEKRRSLASLSEEVVASSPSISKKRPAAKSVAVRKKPRPNTKSLSAKRTIKVTSRSRKSTTLPETISDSSPEAVNLVPELQQENIVPGNFALEEAWPSLEEIPVSLNEVIDQGEPALPAFAIENETCSAEVTPCNPEPETIAEPQSLLQLSATTDESGQLAAPNPWANLFAMLMRAWQWAQKKFKSHQVKKRLRVCESVSLGEKRFIAVIQVDGEQFLVGGSSNSVSTLAHLEKPKNFPDIFHGYEQDLSQA